MKSSPTVLARPAAQPPPGNRPPNPDLGISLLRAAVFTSVLLSFGADTLATWAQPLPTRLLLTEPPEIHTLLPILAGLLVLPQFLGLAQGLALSGMTLLLLELLAAALLMPLQAAAAARMARAVTTLRIRLPLPDGRTTAVVPPHDLLQALQAALPTGGRLSGFGPHITLILARTPDLPAELLIQLTGSASQRRALAETLRGILQSAAPDVQIDAITDPRDTAQHPGSILHWREYASALPSQYPFRLTADATADSTFGALLAALQVGGGVQYAELHLVLRPVGGVSGWALNRGWRGRAMALKLLLEQKADYALRGDPQALEEKLAAAPFEVTLRTLVLAEPGAHTAADQTLRALDAALAGRQHRTGSALQRWQIIRHGQVRCGAPTQQDTRCLAHDTPGRAPRFAPLPSLLLAWHPWHEPAILSSAELAGLWRLPTPDLGRLVAWQTCRILPPPPQAFAAPATDEWVALGSAVRSNGATAAVGTTLRDLRQILHLTAGMGAGKSRLLANLCQQFLPYGFALIDGKGDDQGGSLARIVRERLPLADERRLILIDALDTAWPIGINPLAGVRANQIGDTDQMLGQALALFARLDPETWGKAAGMQQYLQMATLLVLEAQPDPTLAHVKRVLLDELYRARLLERARNHEVVTFWCTIYPSLGEGLRSSRDALLRRFDMLLTAETTRLMVTQPRPTLNLLAAIEQGAIVIMPLPDMTLGGLAGAIGMLLFQAFVRAAFARSGSDQTRASYPLIVDEFQVLLGSGDASDVQTAVTRLRSLGIPTIYAHQALSQLGDLADLMLINAANRVILQTPEPDASSYARSFAADGLTASDISRQPPNEHQYAVLRCGGLPTGPFSMHPLPWPEPVVAELPPDHGLDWRTCLPMPADPIDPLVARLVYAEADEHRAVDELTRLDEEAWGRVLARWNAIRSFQRGYIIKHPGCIPDRLERQRWLSRLWIACPRVLAAADYARSSGASGPGTRN